MSEQTTEKRGTSDSLNSLVGDGETILVFGQTNGQFSQMFNEQWMDAPEEKRIAMEWAALERDIFVNGWIDDRFAFTKLRWRKLKLKIRKMLFPNVNHEPRGAKE